MAKIAVAVAVIAQGCASTRVELTPALAPATADGRSRMRGIDAAASFDAATPDPSLLPTGREWDVALRKPVGNFPTFRANDGSVIVPGARLAEVGSIAASETWLLNRLGRQYTRTTSRQVFAYCAAYNMTGNEQYLRYVRLGLDYLFTTMVDRDDVFYSWIENAEPGPEPAPQRVRRHAQPEEVAGAAVFLCSADASYMTGHVLVVDGGFTAAGLTALSQEDAPATLPRGGRRPKKRREG